MIIGRTCAMSKTPTLTESVYASLMRCAAWLVNQAYSDDTMPDRECDRLKDRAVKMRQTADAYWMWARRIQKG